MVGGLAVALALLLRPELEVWAVRRNVIWADWVHLAYPYRGLGASYVTAARFKAVEQVRGLLDERGTAVHLVKLSGGRTVLDPFAGSGTTALAARKLGRSSVLVEREAGYCAMAARRLQHFSLLTEAQA